MSNATGPSSAARTQAGSNEPTALQRAIAALEKMKARLDATEQAATEPIAIVGMGCRFPGGGEGVDAFWNVLEQGMDAVREIPPKRWDLAQFPADRKEARWAALLDDVSGFEPSFFGISPREAESLDPQQRILLEVAWEAMEDAGQPIEQLFESRTGVFVGICGNDYQQLVAESRQGSFDAYCATGNMYSTAAGRISFVFGFQGPALSIDTACSSSLVALTQACQSLRIRDCDVAIAGGVNAIISPRQMAIFMETQALSPDGRCKTLDARANGFVRGEGCGLLILKRRSDAIRDGDRIRGLIRGWAVNQDGRSTGLTTPNVLSQQAMIRQALERAKLTPADIGYVEMHGTGTSLGDPIEAEALREVLGKPRADASRCVLGAVKTNIGHLEGAAGIAGVIKIALALEREKIPKNLHFRHLNPRISLADTPFVVPTSALAWPRSEKKRFAGVSSFGISGTNAHIILEEAPITEPALTDQTASAYLLPISAKSPQALTTLANTYAQWFADGRLQSLHDVTFTAGARRTHHAYRFGIVAQTHDEFAEKLREFARRKESTQATSSPKVVFVFPGQGSQWVGMGRQLLAEEQVFREALETCEPLILQEAGFSILRQLDANDAAAEHPSIAVVQPLLFAIEIALASLWRSWGIEPDCVVGHSMGEVAAAYIAGMLSLEDAVKVICRRSRLLQRITGQGAMALVELPLADAEAAIAGRESELGIASSNGPRSTVLAGNPNALDQVLANLERQGVFCRRVKVDVASHSPQVEPLRQDLLAALRDLQPRSGKIPLYSTVSEASLQGPELTAAYWFDNLRKPVRFTQVTRQLVMQGHGAFIEMSPHPILLPSIEETIAASGNSGVALASTRRKTDERRSLFESLSTLYHLGFNPNWTSIHRQRGTVVSLPNYPWQRERFWVESPRQTRYARGRDIHPLLGMRFDSSIAPGEHVWQQSVSTSALPFLTDHCIQGEVVFPGTGYVEIGLATALAVYGAGTVVIDEMSLDQMLALAPNAERQLQIVLQKDEDGFAGVAVSSRGENEDSWTRHATIRVRLENPAQPERSDLQRIETRCPNRLDTQAHYAAMNERGLNYGPMFRSVVDVKYGAHEALGRISMPSELASGINDYVVHPALLDACLQAACWAIASKIGSGVFVPKEFIGLRYYRRPQGQLYVHGRLHDSPDESIVAAEIAVCDETGIPFIEIHELRVAVVESTPRTAVDPIDDMLFQLAWREKPLEPRSMPANPGVWLAIIDARGFGAHVVERLRASGESCVEAYVDSTYRSLGDDKYRIDPTDPSHLKRLLEEAFKAPRKCKGVALFSSLDGVTWEQTTSTSLAIDLRRSCISALRTTQALLVQGWRDIPRLYLVTRGVHLIEDKDISVSVGQAGIWGLGRTIALEHPALQCTRIDVSSQPTSAEIDDIVRELISSTPEDQISLRNSRRYVARMVPDTLHTQAPNDFTIRPDRTYLITGGLSGLGLELASWLVHQGARHLLLVGRSAPNSHAMEAITKMTSAGAHVRVMHADISDANQVDRLLALQKSEMPPLAGIAHSAVALDDRTLLDLSEDVFLHVMGAKVFGAFNLHQSTAQEPLDFFLLYSSAAGNFGSPGQGNYAAANTIVDAIARARALQGLPAMSIAWGAFTEVGLAAAQDIRGKRLASRGFDGISPALGLVAIEKLLHHPRPNVAALRFSVRQWEESFPQGATLPLFEELRTRATTHQAASTDVQSIRQELAISANERHFDILLTHVLEQLGRVLRMDPKRIDSNATFVSFGVDSLMSLELRNRLQSSLGLDFRATLLFTYPTANKLTGFLVEQFNKEATASPPPVSAKDSSSEPQQTSAAEALADLNADDLLAMLDEELSATKKVR